MSARCPLEGHHSFNDKELISAHVARVDVKRDHFAIQLSSKSERDNMAQEPRYSAEQDEPVHRDPHVLVVPWKKTPSRRPREIILPASTYSHPDLRPIRAETRAKLVTAVAKGRHWLDELIAGTVTNVEQIASTENCTVRQANMTISPAFLAPKLVQAAVDGRLPVASASQICRMRRPHGPCNTRSSGSRFLSRHHGARNRIFSARD
jgi:site-specific DNA recombinase